MDWKCLLVDLDGMVRDTWQADVEAADLVIPATYTDDVGSASVILDTGTIVSMIVFLDKIRVDHHSCFRAFQNSVGALSEFQLCVSTEPEPMLLAGVYEYGIEQFAALSEWQAAAASLTRSVLEKLEDRASPEAKTMAVFQSIKNANQSEISSLEAELTEIAQYDYRAAYAQGKAREATGNFEAAMESYQASSSLNGMFRPSTSNLGETLLVTGRVDEAINVFQKLEKTNPTHVERKAFLASAYVEKGDFETAQKYVAEAEKLSAGQMSSKVVEAKAQILLSSGKLGEAFKLMDEMSEVGPFFAAKLNEMGIKLSQAGKGKSALALYQKAHKIVRSELKYKISLNAALACRRLNAFDMALKYLVRCEREYGGAFPKLEKIRSSVIAMKKKAAASGGGAKAS